MKRRRKEAQFVTFNKNNALTLPAPAKGRTFYRTADGPTGFRLMVTETGHRTYHLQCKPRGGGSAGWAKIGVVGDISFRALRATEWVETGA